MAADRCRQSLGVVERALDGVATARDREHARGCTPCTRALGRLPAFERDLGAAARSFATEPLPVAVIASPVAPGRVWSGRPMRAIGLVAVAALIVVVAVMESARSRVSTAVSGRRERSSAPKPRSSPRWPTWASAVETRSSMRRRRHNAEDRSARRPWRDRASTFWPSWSVIRRAFRSP